METGNPGPGKKGRSAYKKEQMEGLGRQYKGADARIAWSNDNIGNRSADAEKAKAKGGQRGLKVHAARKTVDEDDKMFRTGETAYEPWTLRQESKVGRRAAELGRENKYPYDKRATQNDMELAKAAYEYINKRQAPNPKKLQELLDAGKISQEGFDKLMSGESGSAPAIRTGLDRAQRDEKYRKDMGLDIHRQRGCSARSAKFRREGYPPEGTDYRTEKKPE